jgi:hypothetical protein
MRKRGQFYFLETQPMQAEGSRKTPPLLLIKPDWACNEPLNSLRATPNPSKIEVTDGYP